MREIEKWVTVKGNRIPIFKGEDVKAKFAEMYRQRYINNWKKQEVDRTIEYYKDLCEKRNQIYDETYMATAYWNDRNYFMKVKGMTLQECIEKHDELYKKREEFEKAHKGALATLSTFSSGNKSDYVQYGVWEMEDGYKLQMKAYKSVWKVNEEKARPVIQKLVDKHFDTLQNKVEKKIGKITSIYHRGDDDYEFTGTDGKCAVEVILAGGYNIQKLHTRWIVRNSLWD